MDLQIGKFVIFHVFLWNDATKFADLGPGEIHMVRASALDKNLIE